MRALSSSSPYGKPKNKLNVVKAPAAGAAAPASRLFGAARPAVQPSPLASPNTGSSLRSASLGASVSAQQHQSSAAAAKPPATEPARQPQQAQRQQQILATLPQRQHQQNSSVQQQASSDRTAPQSAFSSAAHPPAQRPMPAPSRIYQGASATQQFQSSTSAQQSAFQVAAASTQPSTGVTDQQQQFDAAGAVASADDDFPTDDPSFWEQLDRIDEEHAKRKQAEEQMQQQPAQQRTAMPTQQQVQPTTLTQGRGASEIAHSFPTRLSSYNPTANIVRLRFNTRPDGLVLPKSKYWNPEGCPKVDEDAARFFIYPALNKGQQDRGYQRTIVSTALYHNTLVVLPTGLGKTFIAAVVMKNYFEWFPKGKIIFVAPTKPLVQQQMHACYHIVGIPEEETVLLTGRVKSDKRAQHYEKRRVFFATYQTIEHDLDNIRLRKEEVVLVVFDEAHKQIKQSKIMNFLVSSSKPEQFHTRVLALTASPGKDLDSIQSLINNLKIAFVEVRSEQDSDIQEFTIHKDILKEKVELSNEWKALVQRLDRYVSANITRIKSCFPQTLEPEAISLGFIKMVLGRVEEVERSRDTTSPIAANAGFLRQECAFLMTISFIRRLLVFHGLDGFIEHLEKAEKEQKKNLMGKFVKSTDFKVLKDAATRMRNQGIVHPKISQVVNFLRMHFQKPETAKDSRVIVFTQYRQTVEAIVTALGPETPLIKPMKFVGQQNTDKVKGLTQKEQKEIIEKFKSGNYNVLVSTSVGEEGIDVGNCDLVICYDTSQSPIQMIQRIGRAGRKRKGQAIMLLTDKEEQMLDISDAKTKRLAETLRMALAGNAFKKLTFPLEFNNRMIPLEYDPKEKSEVIEPKKLLTDFNALSPSMRVKHKEKVRRQRKNLIIGDTDRMFLNNSYGKFDLSNSSIGLKNALAQSTQGSDIYRHAEFDGTDLVQHGGLTKLYVDVLGMESYNERSFSFKERMKAVSEPSSSLDYNVRRLKQSASTSRPSATEKEDDDEVQLIEDDEEDNEEEEEQVEEDGEIDMDEIGFGVQQDEWDQFGGDEDYGRWTDDGYVPNTLGATAASAALPIEEPVEQVAPPQTQEDDMVKLWLEDQQQLQQEQAPPVAEQAIPQPQAEAFSQVQSPPRATIASYQSPDTSIAQINDDELVLQTSGGQIPLAVLLSGNFRSIHSSASGVVPFDINDRGFRIHSVLKSIEPMEQYVPSDVFLKPSTRANRPKATQPASTQPLQTQQQVYFTAPAPIMILDSQDFAMPSQRLASQDISRSSLPASAPSSQQIVLSQKPNVASQQIAARSQQIKHNSPIQPPSSMVFDIEDEGEDRLEVVANISAAAKSPPMSSRKSTASIPTPAVKRKRLKKGKGTRPKDTAAAAASAAVPAARAPARQSTRRRIMEFVLDEAEEEDGDDIEDDEEEEDEEDARPSKKSRYLDVSAQASDDDEDDDNIADTSLADFIVDGSRETTPHRPKKNKKNRRSSGLDDDEQEEEEDEQSESGAGSPAVNLLALYADSMRSPAAARLGFRSPPRGKIRKANMKIDLDKYLGSQEVEVVELSDAEEAEEGAPEEEDEEDSQDFMDDDE